MAEELPDLNVFMICEQLDEGALSTLQPPYTIRSSRPDELGIWKAFPFDSPSEVVEYDVFMSDFYEATYASQADEFFEATKFVCDEHGTPVATCAIWPAYDGELTTVHWFKVHLGLEGKGIGRALLSEVMRTVPPERYPVYLHTQPGSFRAIKLYSDFGFKILTNDFTGTRPNDHAEAMLLLRDVMPADAFAALETTVAPPRFEDVLRRHPTVEF